MSWSVLVNLAESSFLIELSFVQWLMLGVAAGSRDTARLPSAAFSQPVLGSSPSSSWAASMQNQLEFHRGQVIATAIRV